ncbi:hypothetical protein IWZ00DRAFT_495156 [Phyllosticta capitalensis]
MTSPFESLAEELKDMILEQCDVPTLKSARLACWSFVPTATRHLFKQVTVDIIDPESTEAFVNVAADSVFSRCVKSLVVVVGMGKLVRPDAPDSIYKRRWKLFHKYLEPDLCIHPTDRKKQIPPQFDPGHPRNNPIKDTVAEIFHAVEKLQNIETVSSILREGSRYGSTEGYGSTEDWLNNRQYPGYDPSMNFFMLALSRRLHQGRFRTLHSVTWHKASRRNFDNIWARQEMRRENRPDPNDHPIPIFHMIKHLDLFDVQPGPPPEYDCLTEFGEGDEDDSEVGSSDSDEQINNSWGDANDDYDPNLRGSKARLAWMFSQDANPLESLRLDCGVASIDPHSHFSHDLLKAFRGLALSPRLTKVTLTRFITTARSLLTFLEYVQPTLRDLKIEDAILERRDDRSIVPVQTPAESWIVDHGCLWLLEQDFMLPTIFWERVLVPMREIFISSPLSSLSLSTLIDAVGVNDQDVGSAWNFGRRLFDLEEWFAPHQRNDIHDYLMGHTDVLPPLDEIPFVNKHAEAGCVLCERIAINERRLWKWDDDEGIYLDGSLEEARLVLKLQHGAGLSDEGVVYDL